MKRSRVLSIRFGRRQRGAVLVVSLMMLLVMTLIGVTALRTTTMQERMAGNARDKMLAFEAAEAAMRAAEDYIDNDVVALGSFDDDGSDGLYNNDEVFKNIWEVVDWGGVDGGSNQSISADASVMPGVSAPPEYVIQHYASVQIDVDELNLDNYGQGIGAGEIQMFRITVRGTGGSDNAVVFLQSTYGKLL